jgi:hypothetical protein
MPMPPTVSQLGTSAAAPPGSLLGVGRPGLIGGGALVR